MKVHGELITQVQWISQHINGLKFGKIKIHNKFYTTRLIYKYFFSLKHHLRINSKGISYSFRWLKQEHHRKKKS